MTDKEYLEKKRLEVLEMIKPYCELFGIKNYDYEVLKEGQASEVLKLNNTKINCGGSSFSTVYHELLGYIFIKCYRRSLGHFETHVKNVIKQYWAK